MFIEIVLPLVTQLDTSDSLEGLFFQVVAGVVVVVLHLCFLQIIVSNNKDYSELPILFVSWFFHLERTDPVGWESLERVASSSFPTGR